MVSDAGGFDDHSFNVRRQGLQGAVAETGIEDKVVESKAETDYTPNVDNLVAEDCGDHRDRRLPARRRDQTARPRRTRTIKFAHRRPP